MKRLILCLIFCALAVAGCIPNKMRIVDTQNNAEFVNMSRAMRPAMVERNLVGADGSWYSPLIASEDTEAGAILFKRLSPAFCAEDLKIPAGSSFPEELMPQDSVRIFPSKAVIRMDRHEVTLQLVAKTDWNGDKKQDWLVNCRISQPDMPYRVREYFLLVLDPSRPVLQPHVLMARDHLHKKTSIVIDNSAAEFMDAVTVELEQGQADITVAPSSATQGYDKSGVQSSALNN
ncbi:MAG: hypothetical protein IJY48_08860 [Mailhella sp.]|nr:hypothetical protein [Mailhella sp.]MBQ8744215.1 hypothetical protein [Mailhella sp.]MBQ9106214.1 hypothetical protein [Mailhella sp.]